MTIEARVAKLENEAAALKAAFVRSATTMPIYTKTAQIATTQNLIRYQFDYEGQHVDYEATGSERIVVTLRTPNAINTIAKLEVATNYVNAKPTVRRIPYAGGARWIVMGMSNGGGSNWQSTTYNISVLTMVDGTLTVEEAKS